MDTQTGAEPTWGGTAPRGHHEQPKHRPEAEVSFKDAVMGSGKNAGVARVQGPWRERGPEPLMWGGPVLVVRGQSRFN